MRAARRLRRRPRFLGLDPLLAIFVALSLLPAAPGGDGPGVLAAPSHQLTGSWEPIPAPPSGNPIADAVLLGDGRIAVMHFRGGECLSVYSPATQTWEEPVVTWPDGWTTCFNQQDSFVLAPDGLLYSSQGFVVDPETWIVDTGPWPGNDYGVFNSIGITPDGQVYVPVVFTGPETRLHPLDVETGELGSPSVIDAPYHFIVGGPSARIFLGHDWVDRMGDRLVSYDPESDAWHAELPAPDQMHWPAAQHGPGGWIYATPTGDEFDAVYARDPSDGEWLSVVLPPDLRPHWRPTFVDGGDGRLYVIDVRQSYIFTPGAIEPIPTPEPAPSEPPGQGGATTPDQGGLMPDTATPDRNPGNALAVGALMGVVGAVAVAVVRRRYGVVRVMPPR